MSDDISMGALSGIDRRADPRSDRVPGCDIVLHCNGEIDEMQAVAGVVPALAGSRARAPTRRWRRGIDPPIPI